MILSYNLIVSKILTKMQRSDNCGHQRGQSLGQSCVPFILLVWNSSEGKC